MSLEGAASALNVPEPLVQRSAEARAKATGTPVDEVLAAWASGASAPAATAPSDEAAPETEPTPAEDAAPEGDAPEPEASPEPVTTPTAAQPAAAATGPAPVRSGPTTPPILTGRTERPILTGAAATGLLLLALVFGFIVPALPQEGNGVYTSALPFSEAALDGRDVYREAGCAACHTQVVRPIVADAGLGGVTAPDSNQVLGTRRYGPDLAHVGSRYESDADFFSILQGSGNHPSYSHLGDEAINDLVAYLAASR